MLWLGCPESSVTWNQHLHSYTNCKITFEAGITAETNVTATSLYGHVSATITVDSNSMVGGEPKAKRREVQA